MYLAINGTQSYGISWNSDISSVPTLADTIPQAIPAWEWDCIPLMLKSIVQMCCGLYHVLHTYIWLVPMGYIGDIGTYMPRLDQWIRESFRKKDRLWSGCRTIYALSRERDSIKENSIIEILSLLRGLRQDH